MLGPILILLAGFGFGQYEIEKEGFKVRVEVEASIYRYEVHNINLPPIRSFSIQPHHAYNFEAPEGWTTHEEGGLFKAEADDVFSAILAGQQRTFSMRVTSGGAVLGKMPLTLGPYTETSLRFARMLSGIKRPVEQGLGDSDHHESPG
ncbi:MAG: hypothetical protein GXY44_11205 [Phycisphaerales bacterium]|nr:hypothetical protein [Phycisphaerales bacterium]